MKTAASQTDPKLASLLGLARSQGGVFSRAQARALGYSWRRLDTLARRWAITPLLDQWFVPSAAKPTHVSIAHALTLRFGSEAVVSGAAAAQWLGAVGEWPERFGVNKPMVYLGDPSHIRTEDTRIIRRTFDGAVLTRDRLRLADRTTALLDCVDGVSKTNREGLLDLLLQQRWLKRDLVEARVAARRDSRHGGRSTAAQIQAQRHVTEGTESAAERLLRRTLIGAGLRQGGRLGWQPNHLVRVPDQGADQGGDGHPHAQGNGHSHAPGNGQSHAPGNGHSHAPGDGALRLARLDFAWPDCRLAVEVDGRAFHSADQAFESDRDRRNDLEAAGWMVLNVTWKALRNSPDSVLRRIHAGLRHQRASP